MIARVLAGMLAVGWLVGGLGPVLAEEGQGPQVSPRAAALADEILAQAGATKGLCLDIACGSGELAQAVAGRSQLFVHCLSGDPAQVESARDRLEKAGLYVRRTAVQAGTPARLPYPDRCANLVIRGDLFERAEPATSWREVVRVLRPGGVAYLGQPAGSAGPSHLTAQSLREQLVGLEGADVQIVEKDGLWVRIRRQPLTGVSDWSHGIVGSPGNNPCAEDERVKAPFQTLWIGGPSSFTKFGIPLLVSGRVLLRHGGITGDSRWKPAAEGDLIQAFDAYNGAPLWEHRLAEVSGDGFVAVGEQVFAAAGDTLYVLEAADGKVRYKLAPGGLVEDMKGWAYYGCADGVLVAGLLAEARDFTKPLSSQRIAALAGVSAADGKRLWKLAPAGGIGAIALAPGAALFTTAGQLTSVELASGKQRWSVPAKDSRDLRCYRGRVYCSGQVFCVEDGKDLGIARVAGVIVGDRVYAGGLKGITVTDLATGRKLDDDLVARRDPYCPKTGIPDGCSFMYGRCIKTTASMHCYFFHYSGTVIGDLISKRVFACEAIRANCRTGVIAGNGLVYNSPSGCGCAFAVRAGVALTPVDAALYSARPPFEPAEPLEKGPAFDEPVEGTDSADNWPCLRRDAGRSNVTPARIGLPKQQKWATRLAGPITAPAVAGGVAVVGSDDHSIYGLDAATGQLRWRYRTGGAIHVTPALWRGRVFAGSQDGWVYCLRADSGKLIWRFRGGPYERMMILSGRPQSLWPIGGGVLVDDGVAYFYAGYCSHDRVFVHALDARTGRSIWRNDQAGEAVEVTGMAGGLAPHGVSPGGPLAASAKILYVPHGMYAPAAFDRASGKLLWWGRRGDSEQRSNIEVQNVGGPNLSVAGGLLFFGGSNRLTGTAQPFVAADARSGRLWGADDPALFERAGRDPAGKAVVVERSMFGTKPIQFGGQVAPVVADGGVFISGYRGGFLDLDKYLRTQLAPAAGPMDKWPNKPPAGSPVVTADKVVFADGKRLTIVSRADGGKLAEATAEGVEGMFAPDGLAVAAGRLYLVTRAGEVVCFAGD